MEITQEILLPVLLAAIIGNTVILVLVVVASRLGRRDRMTTTRSALEGSMLSTSFVDRSAGSAWASGGGAEAGTARDEGADILDDAPEATSAMKRL